MSDDIPQHPPPWKFYYPGDGETAEDAQESEVISRYARATDAALWACEYDHDNRDGWERAQGVEFEIAVISPKGVETRFMGRHEPAIDHNIRAIKPEDGA